MVHKWGERGLFFRATESQVTPHIEMVCLNIRFEQVCTALIRELVSSFIMIIFDNFDESVRDMLIFSI